LEQIDNIADAAKDSSRIFSQRRIADCAIDYMLKRDVEKFIAKCLDAADSLRKAVSALGEKNAKTEVVKFASEVERKENEADDNRACTLENLLKNEIRRPGYNVNLLIRESCTTYQHNR
jgi:uncharacterized protein Yka (UPF0111/DUF47 family)